MVASWLPLVFTAGWGSGFNGYLVTLLLGLGGRYLGVDAVPPALTDGRVIIIAAILALVQIVADKIPYVDSLWDAVHTFIRPAIGGALGLVLSGQTDSWQSAGAASLGGGVALAAHAAKATTRLAVNTSPEPFSNLLVSTGEDLSVSAVVALALAWPWVAASLAAVLLVLATVIAVLLWRATRRFAGEVRERLRRVGQRAAGATGATPAP